MSENTSIEWTHATFNPWWGCQKVSPGCDHCYAERDAKRFSSGEILWGINSVRRVFGDSHWAGPLKWNEKAKEANTRTRVFCASMADVFDNHAVAEALRPRLWKLIKTTPHLDWQILTKRVGNIESRLPEDWENGYPNVWLGISVVNEEEFWRDVPRLEDIPARIRWLSLEPLLGPIKLPAFLDRLHWIVAGGESGPNARRPNPDWFRSIRDECARQGVPYLFKQWGEYDAQGRKVGKKAAGRVLDGVTHDGYPK